MSPKTLQDGFFWANHEFFSWPSIARRILPTGQRLAARTAMNLAFRHLVRRTAPKGSISPLSEVIQSLRVKLPSLATENLIPNALHALKEKATGAAQQIDRFLQVQVKRSDVARAADETAPSRPALHLELVGTLDESGARELRKRLLDAVREAKLEIVVNFEHVRHATPQAVQALIDGEYLKTLKAHASVKFINLKTAFQAAVERISPPRPGVWGDETIG
jgi:anti-anti-sigma regulatory factor